MTADEFIAARRPDWERLGLLLDQAQGARLRSLSEDDLEALGHLYRAATSDLAVARRDFPRHRVTSYLNALTGRAHSLVYRGEPLDLRRVWHFFVRTFPGVFRRTARYTFLSAALFLLPAALAFTVVVVDPDAARLLLPESQVQIIERGEMWTDIPVQVRSIASSFIMTNNIQVAFLAFAGGVLLGSVTVYVLVLNGLLIGATAGLCQVHGLSLPLWSFVLPHGVLELSVIFLAGGSGLMLGTAVLSPGLLRRRDALRLAAREAVQLLLGAVPLLVVAGILEGFVSPSQLPFWVKACVGAGSGIPLYAYLLRAGRASTAAGAHPRHTLARLRPGDAGG